MVEVLPANELPAGVPAPSVSPHKAVHGPRGQFVPGETAKRIGALGGAARAEQRRLASLLGRISLPEEHPLYGYRRDASDWRDAHLRRLAQTVGGGEVGPAVQAIVSSSALQHAASRWLMDQFALKLDHALALAASKLADSARQGILAAHELCAREALSRRAQVRADPQAAFRARLAAQAATPPADVPSPSGPSSDR
jgi:hypothetical protein